MILIESIFDNSIVAIESTNTYIVIESSFLGGGGGGGTWGTITGTLSNQTDLQSALDAKVPYSGATGNVTLGEYGISTGYSQFDTTPTQAGGVGRLIWNDTDGTLDLGLKGGNVTLQIGQEQVVRVVNKTGSTLQEAAYQVVRVSTAQGQRLGVALAQADNDPNSADTLGIVTETISNNQEGFITVSGLVNGINTTGSLQSETWADGDILYLSATTAGAITKVRPTAPNHAVILGYVVYAHANNGKIFVKIDNGYELDELHNVLISSPTNGQVLRYNSTSGVWENQTISTANIYNSNGTLTGARTVTMATYPLTFSGGTINADRVSIGYLTGDAVLSVQGDSQLWGTANFQSTKGNQISHIHYGTNGNILLRSAATAGVVAMQTAGGNVLIGTETDGTSKLQIRSGSSSTGNALLVQNSTPTDLFTVANTGTSTFSGSITAASAIARGVRLTSTLVAAANNDVLVGLDIAPTFTNGAFTGVTNYGIRITNSSASWIGLNATSGPSNYSGIKFQSSNVDRYLMAMRTSDGQLAISRWNSSGVFQGDNMVFYNATGNVVISGSGSTTDNGYRLDVVGTGRYQGNLNISTGGITIAGGSLTLTSSITRMIAITGNRFTINENSTGPPNETGFVTTFASGSNIRSIFQITHTGVNSAYFGVDGTTKFVIGSESTTPIVFRNGMLFNSTDILSSGTELGRFHTNGYFGIGVTSPTSILDLSASTTSRSSLRIRSGVAPTSPNDGDIWYDGTDLKIRVGTTTKTFTLI